MKRKDKIALSVVISFTFLYILIFIIFAFFIGKQPIDEKLDKFGIKKIYHTKTGGREWFINENNPTHDPLFFITSNINIKKQEDGSWHINNSQIRINVGTLIFEEQWKDVEMTGYIKAISPIKNKKDENSNEDSQITWRARSGRHNGNDPCAGTALGVSLNIDGSSFWKKEIWHKGGYTDAVAKTKATDDSILNKWIGWKLVLYDVNRNVNDRAVKMEAYVDEKNNNQWRKVSEVVDNGNWSVNSKEEFHKVDCGRPINYIITNAGPIITFRADDLALNFKDLSVREIQTTNR